MSVVLLKAKVELSKIKRRIARTVDRGKLREMKIGLKDDLVDINHDLREIKNPIIVRQLKSLKKDVTNTIKRIDKKIKPKKKKKKHKKKKTVKKKKTAKKRKVTKKKTSRKKK